MSNTPKISVVMPAYNAERFIKQAIESILAQTFTDFEFIIINDGSKDATEGIIKSFLDPRIVYIENPENRGLSYSFNHGIRAARGKYIARMDADDVSLPVRFKTQFDFLETHPDISILGSSMIEIDENGRRKIFLRREPTHLGIKWSSLFSTPMYHPTIMARTEVLREHQYNEELSNSEDYELWSRLLFKTHVRFANIVRPLFYYRAYSTSFTQSVNLDKRVISAHNTLSNLGFYVNVSPSDRRALVLLRQERRLSLKALLSLHLLYLKASFSFITKEHPSAMEILHMYEKMAGFKLFLLKHYVKHH